LNYLSCLSLSVNETINCSSIINTVELNSFSGTISNLSTLNVNISSLLIAERINVHTISQSTGLVNLTNLSAGTCSLIYISSRNMSINNITACTLTASVLTSNYITCPNINGLSDIQFTFLQNITGDVQVTMDNMLNMLYNIRPSLDDFNCYNGTFNNLVTTFGQVNACLIADTLVTDYMIVNTSLYATDAQFSGQASFFYPILNGYSDIRLKTITNELNQQECLEKLCNLKCFKYVPNASSFESMGIQITQKEDYGLSAQDVKSVFPELVDTAPLPLSSQNSSEPFLTVRYERFIPIIIAAIQELNKTR
jgi:Chaperone of endosialidase